MSVLLPLKIVIGGIVGATVVSGAIFGGIILGDYLDSSVDEDRPLTVREKLGDLLLDTSLYDAEIGARRKIKLDNAVRGARFFVDSSLSSESNGSQIMRGCNSHLDDEVLWDSDTLFLNIKKFCTKDIRDVFKKGELIEESENGDKAKDRLRNAQVSHDMNKVKNDLDTPNKNSLKEYCLLNYDVPFDPEDEKYLNVKSYCTVVKE